MENVAGDKANIPPPPPDISYHPTLQTSPTTPTPTPPLTPTPTTQEKKKKKKGNKQKKKEGSKEEEIMIVKEVHIQPPTPVDYKDQFGLSKAIKAGDEQVLQKIAVNYQRNKKGERSVGEGGREEGREYRQIEETQMTQDGNSYDTTSSQGETDKTQREGPETYSQGAECTQEEVAELDRYLGEVETGEGTEQG